jgi:hypothetical protein
MGIMGMRLSKSKHGLASQRLSPTIHIPLESPPHHTETTHSPTPAESCLLIESQETDALYDAYQEYMAESMAQHGDVECLVECNNKENHNKTEMVEDATCYIQTVSDRPKTDKIPSTLPTVGKSYVDSMKRLAQMRCHSDRKKATGVTRRLMEEVLVAKENMFIYRRLVRISPSEDVSRKNHRKEFTKSRYLLDKMSRYDSAPYSATIHLKNKAPWIDNF